MLAVPPGGGKISTNRVALSTPLSERNPDDNRRIFGYKECAQKEIDLLQPIEAKFGDPNRKVLGQHPGAFFDRGFHNA